MEIIFNKVSYVDKNLIESNVLNNINLIFKEGNIYSFIGESLDIIPKLLCVIKRPSSGEIKINNMIIRRTSHINNIQLLRKDIGYVSGSLFFLKSNVKEEIKEIMKNYGYETKNVIKHIVDSLKLVGLDESYLERDVNTLSTSERKKVVLASVLSYNPGVIVLDHFFDGLIFRDKEYFKKLFLKLKSKYKKIIILLNRTIEDTFQLVDKIYVINKGELIFTGGKELYYNPKIYKYIEKPKIVEFTQYAQETGHDILEYTDIKELLKELYRNVR